MVEKEKWVFTFGPQGVTFQGQPMEVPSMKENFERYFGEKPIDTMIFPFSVLDLNDISKDTGITLASVYSVCVEMTTSPTVQGCNDANVFDGKSIEWKKAFTVGWILSEIHHE
jgi:hypothetical protein